MTRKRAAQSHAVSDEAAAYIADALMELGIKYQVQRLKKSVDAPCFPSAF
jgi:hypothetical protein